MRASGGVALGHSVLSQLKGMFSLFQGGGVPCVGVSIGSSSIKIVEIKRVGRQWKLLHFGMIQLPEDAIVNREILNPVAVIESLRTLTSQLKLKTKSVCTSISGTSVIIKRMQVEVQNMKELQDQVFWEAEQYLPFDVSEVVMDYHLLGPVRDRKADVILVAAKKSSVEVYLNCLAEGGLKPKVVDLDYFALQNLYEVNYPQNPQEAVALVDIGASSMKVVVIQNGIPVFTKDSALGGRNLTTEIQRQLNLSFKDAEILKVGGQDTGMPQEVSDLMNIMCENYATEIKRSLDFYQASSSGAMVSYILLTGGGAKVPNLSRIIEDSIRLPTQLMNPFGAITYDSNVFTPEYISMIAPVAAVPLGLALRMGTR